MILWTVLRNDAGQHGIYPAHRPTPAGWASIGFTASDEECRQWLEEQTLTQRGPAEEEA